MKARVFRWMFSLGLVAAAWPAGSRGKTRLEISFAASRTSFAAGEDASLHPIKKRVGRAVTSTMDKIGNPWFVISQVLVPLCLLLFSLMYVRRYRARHAAENGSPIMDGEDIVKSKRLDDRGDSLEAKKDQ